MRFLGTIILFSSLVLAQREIVGQKIIVQGIDTDTPKSTITKTRLEPQKLLLETSVGVISILGYPAWLESQKLVGTTLTTAFRLRPDGAETRLEFSRSQRPFLIIGSSTSPNSLLVGNWRFALKIAEKSAFITLEPQTIALPLEKNVLVKQGLLLWCVRLAALHLPVPPTPNVANEAETPRFDWAALRVSRATQCQN